MDIYGMSSTGQDYFGVDELLDFSNDEDHVFSGNAVTTADFDHRMNHQVFSSSDNNNNNNAADASQLYYSSIGDNYNHHHLSTDFADQFCVPSEEAAELEWLSKFVDDSVTNFPANNLAGTINFRTESSFHGRSRSKRTRAPSNNTGWTSTIPIIEKPNNAGENKGTKKRESYSSSQSPDSSSSESVIRRCTHCASEKTPQWRTGPLGPKTLCNACGVRYKSGRLVPEYRPAASPTFVLTQHSNSHRKVMELRRQKELVVGQQQQQHQHQHQQKPSPEHQLYGGGGGRHHHSNFEVC